MTAVTGTNWTAYDAATMTAREIYGRTLAQMGKTNEKIVVCAGFIKKTTESCISKKPFPERFFNVGIAEQNMMGTQQAWQKQDCTLRIDNGGLSSMRAGEQVRTDIAYQNLPVKIIATHAGISFGHAGTTHHCTEDLAILKSIANMTVIFPADGIETSKAVRACVDIYGPYT